MLARGLLGGILVDVNGQPLAEAAIEAGLVTPEDGPFLHDLLELPLSPDLVGFFDAVPGEERRRRKELTLSTMVAAVASRKPLLIAVEDVHWADKDTLSAMAAVAKAAVRVPALLLMTSRPEGNPLDGAWRSMAQGTSLATFDLPPLARDEASALAGAFSDRHGEAIGAVVDRAAGNPLFLVQLLHHAAMGGEEALPDSIRSLALARLDRLAQSDRRAAQVASVLGQRFSLAALRHLLDDQFASPANLIEAHLLRPTEDDYAFTHALIHEAVYAALPKSRRQTLHKRAAAWYRDRDVALHAQHLDRAGDPAAPAAYFEAARSSAAVHRTDQALLMNRRGLDLAGEQRDKHKLEMQRGELLQDAGDIPGSVEAFTSALRLASDDLERCRARIGIAQGLRISDDLSGAMATLDQAEALAKVDGQAVELAQIHHLRGNLLFPQGRMEECLAEHERSLAFAKQAGSVEAEARALGGLGDAHYAQGRLITAHRMFQACVDLAQRHGLGRIEIANLPMAAYTGYYAGHLEHATAQINDALTKAARTGQLRAEMIAHHVASLLTIEEGDIAASYRHIERANEIAHLLGARRFESEGLAILAQIARISGHREKALPLARTALADARETGLRYFGPVALAEVAASTDDPAERQAALTEGVAVLASSAISHNHLLFYLAAAELELREGRWSEAERWAQALETYLAPEPLPWAEAIVSAVRLLARHGRGERGPELRAALARAMEQARSLRMLTRAKRIEAVLAA